MRAAPAWASSEPFSLGPRDARAGVLLVHGFTGTPFEMRLLGEHLAAQGFRVVGPRLAGHGATTAALAATRWPDWVGTAEEAFGALAAEVPVVGAVGLSMGGLVTLELARRHPRRLRAVGLLATALRLPDAAERMDAVIGSVWPLLPARLRDRLALPKLAGSDLGDPALRRLNGIAQGRAGMPLSALRSLFELGAYLRPRLGEVQQPAFVAHGARDRTVPPSASEELARGLPHVEEKHLFLASRHVLTLDVERGPLFSLLTAFLRRHLGEPTKE